MLAKLKSWFVPVHGSWKEFWLAGMPFLLILLLPGLLTLFPAVEEIPDWMKQAILLGLAALLVGLGTIGFFVGLPRWSLSYAGILITILSYLFLMGVDFLGVLTFPAKWDLWTTFVFVAVFLLFLFTLVALIIFIAGRVRMTASFIQQIWADRTLLPFMMYSGTLVLVMLNYDEVRGGGLVIVSALAMLAGAWGYLRANSGAGRILALIIGITVALLATLAANLMYSVIPLPPNMMIGPFSISRVVVYLSLTWLISLLMIGLANWVRFPFKRSV
ncbi:MAG: hypothetical protein P8Y68_09950 [Anaerolineales bacterium]